MSHFQNTAEFAAELDRQDKLSHMRSQFIFPQHDGRDVYYFTGNSLGLQPKAAKEALQIELDDWGKYGVEGHFEAVHPWFSYHEMFKPLLAEVVGAKPVEVTAMGGLTSNLHFLMVSFYKPTAQKFKILCEAKAFPSDQYALETQVQFHGYDPAEAIIEIAPREGEHTIREEDIFIAIEEHKDELALVMFGGVNYYTGQLFPMKEITEKAHAHDIYVGFDLAHAAGNIQLQLHDWNVDFAAWCSYKYLNSGPGSVAGIFVHERHGKGDLVRFAGWWGNDPSSRFLMEKGFVAAEGADGWQMSNAPVLAMAVHKVALDQFAEAGMDNLCAKRDQMTAFLEFVIRDVASEVNDFEVELITPTELHRRGAQLSLHAKGRGKELFDALTDKGVIADWREPNVIRLAPVPMYNSYEDCYQFGQILRESI